MGKTKGKSKRNKSYESLELANRVLPPAGEVDLSQRSLVDLISDLSKIGRSTIKTAQRHGNGQLMEERRNTLFNDLFSGKPIKEIK